MNIYLLLIIGAFLLSIVCGFVFIPIILNYCKEHNLYDIPNARKIHSNYVPRLGGICFLPSMLIAFLIAIIAMGLSQGKQVTVSLWSIYFLAGLLMIYSVGIIDDIIGVRPRTKFLVQIAAACFLPLAGLYINTLYGFCGITDIPYYIGMPLTIFVIVFIVNSINLIDGIDGLCASLTILSLGGYFYLFFQQRILVYCMLIAGLIGVLVPYLYFNIWGKVENNRKIFMGDSGSLTLGYVLAFLFVKYAMHNPLVMPYRTDGLLLSFTFLIIPVFDVVRIILMRTIKHRPIFGADKNHIHHKLMRAGLTAHQTLVALLLFSVFFIALNFSLNSMIYASYIVVIDIIIYTVFHLILDRIIGIRGGQPFE